MERERENKQLVSIVCMSVSSHLLFFSSKKRPTDNRVRSSRKEELAGNVVQGQE